MRKLQLVSIIALLLLSVGFVLRKQPLPAEGIYPVKLRSLTYYDLAFGEIPGIQGSMAELTESKPATLTLDKELEKIENPTFGHFNVGNNGQKVWFLIVKDTGGTWSEVFVDQNSDNVLESNERLKAVQPYQIKEKGYYKNGAISIAAFPILVSFKGTRTQYEKKQYFFMDIDTISKKSESETMVRLLSSSFLSGEMRALFGKTYKQVKFQIIDGNGNGCFNDYGKDILMLDSDFDGIFTKRECRPLTEFFDISGPDKRKKQLRLVVEPHPSKVMVVEAIKDVDHTELEAVSDPKDDDI